MMISGGGPAFTDKKPIEDYTVGSGTAFGAELTDQIDTSFLANVARQGKIGLERQARTDAMRRAKPIHRASETYDAETARKKVSEAGVDYTIPDEGVQIDEFETMLELRKRQKREGITISRRPKTWLGAGAVLAGDFAAGAIDPVNVAASYIPIVGQLRYARWLERAGSAGGRAAVRLGVGGAEGVVGSAVYEGLNLSTNRSLPENYGLADSFLNVVFGGLLGAGLHTTGGLGRDLIFGVEPYRPSLPVAQTALQRTVVDADAARTFDVVPIVESAAAKDAAQDIGRLRRQLGKIDIEETKALDAAITGERIGERGTVQERVTSLRAETERLSAEIEAVRAKAAAAVDEDTPSRLASIARELSGEIPAKRRADLEAEQRLLTEGRALSPEQEARNRESYLAEAKGLEAAQKRAERDLRRAEADAAKVAQGQTAAERAFDQASGRITSRRDDVLALSTRAVRRWAATVGKSMDAEAARDIAARLMSTPADEIQSAIDREFAALGGEGITRAPVVSDVYDPGTKTEPPEMAAVRQEAEKAVKRQQTPEDYAVELDEEIEGYSNVIDLAKARETLTEEDTAAIEGAREVQKHSALLVRATQAAAACIIGIV